MEKCHLFELIRLYANSSSPIFITANTARYTGIIPIPTACLSAVNGRRQKTSCRDNVRRTDMSNTTVPTPLVLPQAAATTLPTVAWHGIATSVWWLMPT